MSLRRIITRLLVFLAAFTAVSCIDGREEVWLNADGSGRAEANYSLPAAAARLQGGEAGIAKLIEGFLKNTPAITSSSHEITIKGDRLNVRVNVAFDSALKLGEISAGDSIKELPPAATGLTGIVKVALRGTTVDFSRTINAGRSLRGSSFMPRAQFEGRSLEYIIHLPLAATESNASRIENGGKTLIWNFPLTQALQGPATIRFNAPVPIPLWLYFAAACGLAALGWLAWRILKARKIQTNA